MAVAVALLALTNPAPAEEIVTPQEPSEEAVQEIPEETEEEAPEEEPEEEEPEEAPQDFSLTVEWENFNAYVKEGSSIRFRGTLTSTAPMRRLVARTLNLRQMEQLGEYVWNAGQGEDVYSLSLNDMRKSLFPSYETGDFLIQITVWSDGDASAVLEQRMYVAGDLSAPRNLNEACRFSCTDKDARHLLDGRVSSGWEPGSPSDVLRIALPGDRAAEALSICWMVEPKLALIRYLGTDGGLIEEQRVGEGEFVPLHAYYLVPEGTNAIEIAIPGLESGIGELMVLERDYIPNAVQRWRETAEKWDLMLVSTHQDDEHIFFGACISEYVTKGKEVGVVYMANCGRNRYTEALDGLWAAGLSNYPVFLGMRDGIIDTKSGAYKYWDGEEVVVRALVEQIRKYKPEVVLSHDFDGEYDNSQHKVTAECVARAVECAADPQQYPESAQEYGAWQAKKLYIHLYENDEIVFDWERPMEGFSGLSGFDISKMCYSMHRSQQKWVQYSLGLHYSNERFGLYYSAVGPDVEHKSLFEHLD